MGKVKFEIGAELDMLDKGEFTAGLAEHRRLQGDPLAGKKYRRLPPIRGAAVGGALNIGGDVPWPPTPGASPAPATQCGPAQGYVWSVKLLSLNGLAAGDLVNLFINGAANSLSWWQFSSTAFFAKFGKGDLMVLPGEYISLQSVGAFTSTAQITLIGSLWQVPAEKIGLLF